MLTARAPKATQCEVRRIEATLTHLPDMRLRLKRLEKAVAKLGE